MRQNKIIASLLLGSMVSSIAAPSAFAASPSATLSKYANQSEVDTDYSGNNLDGTKLQTSPYEVCKDLTMISQSDFDRNKAFWDEAKECGVDVKVLPDAGFFSQITDRLNAKNGGVDRSIKFMKKVADRAIAKIDQNIMKAERLQACVKDAAKDPAGKAWFAAKVKADPARKAEYDMANCAKHIAFAKSAIKEVSPKIREAHGVISNFENGFSKAIKGVQYATGNNLTIENQVMSADEQKNVKKLVEKFNADTNVAIKDEVKKYDQVMEQNEAEVKKLKAELSAAQAKGDMGAYDRLELAIREKSDVNFAEVPSWYKNYYSGKQNGDPVEAALEGARYTKGSELLLNTRQEVLNHLQAVPVAGYLSSENPSDGEFIAAMQKVIDNAKASKNNVKKALVTEKWVGGGKGGAAKLKIQGADLANQMMDVMQYGPIVNEILKEDPKSCQDASMIANSILTSKNRRDAGFIVAMVGAGIAGGFLGPALLGGAAVTGTAAAALASTAGAGLVAGGMYYDDYKIMAAAEERAFSNIDNKNNGETVAEMKEFSEARDTFMMDVAFAPLDLIGSGIGGGLINAGKRTATKFAAKKELTQAFKAKGMTDKEVTKLYKDLNSPDLVTSRPATLKALEALGENPEKVKFLQTAASKGLFRVKNKETVEMIGRLSNPETLKAAQSIIKGMERAGINPGNQKLLEHVAIAAAEFGVKDPEQFGKYVMEWDEGLDALAQTFDLAAKKMKEPKLRSIASLEARQKQAYDDALDEMRPKSPTYSKMDDAQWEKVKADNLSCPLGKKM